MFDDAGMAPVITPASFPTPHLALRSPDEEQLTRVRAFAVHQAEAAEVACGELRKVWRDKDSRGVRLREVHQGLIEWRYRLALQAPGRLGTGIALDAERFRLAIDGNGANYDRIGSIGRLRANSVWDEDSHTFQGGSSTPAYEIMLEHGRAAEVRFATGEDTLSNQVVLPDGEVLSGNTLVRGEAAKRIANELAERIARRLGRAKEVETGGNPMYAVTADDSARARMFAAAIGLLAAAEPEDLAAWQAARYLLFQSPPTKKGSDAVTRTFLVAVAAVLLNRAPVLEQDVDLRCVVHSQADATTMPSDTV